MLSPISCVRFAAIWLLLSPAALWTAAVAHPLAHPQSSAVNRVPRHGHVILVAFENKGYEDVLGSKDMPYLNSLIDRYAVTDNFYANFHPSIDNYFMATAGDNPAHNDDDYCNHLTTPQCHPGDNIVRRLLAAGKTWKVYAQSIPGSPLTHGGYLAGKNQPYLKRHNPVAYFSDMLEDDQAAGIVNLDELSFDLQEHRLPDWSLIVPDVWNDAHDCPEDREFCSLGTKMAAADHFLRNVIEPVVDSPYCTGPSADCLVIIWWDEAQTGDGRHGGGRVAQVFIGPKVKPGYHSPRFYQQQSILRTMLEALGIEEFPGAAASAPAMSDLFLAPSHGN